MHSVELFLGRNGRSELNSIAHSQLNTKQCGMSRFCGTRYAERVPKTIMKEVSMEDLVLNYFITQAGR